MRFQTILVAQLAASALARPLVQDAVVTEGLPTSGPPILGKNDKIAAGVTGFAKGTATGIGAILTGAGSGIGQLLLGKAPKDAKAPKDGKTPSGLKQRVGGLGTLLMGTGSGVAKVLNGAGTGLNGGFQGTGMDVRASLEALDKQVVALGQQVQAFDGDSFKALDLLTATDKVISDMKVTTANLKASKDIGLFDGVGILPVFETFTPDVRRTMDAVAAKKPQFVKSEIDGVVIDKLKQMQVAGMDFDDAVVERLDLISKPFGKGFYHPIDKAIKKGIANLGGTPAAGGSSGSKGANGIGDIAPPPPSEAGSEAASDPPMSDDM